MVRASHTTSRKDPKLTVTRKTSTYDLVAMEPPAARRGRRNSEVASILDKVAADATGQWFQMATSPSKTGANGILASIRTPDRVLPAPVEYFEFTTRVHTDEDDPTKGTSELYVRWIGEKGAKEKAEAKAAKAAAAPSGAPAKRGPGRPRKDADSAK